MQRVHWTIGIVAVVTGVAGVFDLPEKWEAMMDSLEWVARIINENAAHPTLVFAAIGLLIGGGVIPPAVNVIVNRIFFRKAVAEFVTEFDATADDRAEFRRHVDNVYIKWREEQHPETAAAFLKTIEIPESLPVAPMGSLLEWSSTIPPQFEDNYRLMWDFAECLVFEGRSADKYRRFVAKFWNRWGQKITNGDLMPSDIEAQLRSNALDLLVLTYWEPAQLKNSGWDEGRGKVGLFDLAHEADKLRSKNGTGPVPEP